MPEVHSPTNETGQDPPMEVPLSRVLALEARVRSLANMVGSLDQTSTVAGKEGNSGPMHANSAIQHQSSDRTTPYYGHLSKQGGGKYRYVEPAFWAAMCQDVNELGKKSKGGRHIVSCSTLTLAYMSETRLTHPPFSS